ncbi:MAG: molecular chaperone HtpG [Ignavibacteriae bacterium]|nr:molecular chaperone HtpG [Ignavibacteriota bacterium]MCB9207125.1 molecular chaperone HtpG [Ignavibacteriales bacterium]MCB9218663.1 molecular chaperone HtpG [Ignavibacteriales bacterium]MCB9259331.1 molecular chaperone HtpG [Ignavibacteriales bacterium]
MSETKVEETKLEFKAEVKQLLDILVHSLYTHKEIFLRELISNASDAMDKLRFESNKGTEIQDNDLPLEINITFDKDKKIVYVSDSGIGMSKDDLVNNIGTIAKSGTSDFLKVMAESKEDASNIIGRFGIGFYSVFMVAKEVVIKTKSFKKDQPAIKWISDGLGSYTIAELDEPKKRGTLIEVHLKDEMDEFLEKYRLDSIVKKHSSFISFPIKVENEVVNTVQALWREPKSSIKPEKYTEFYKFLTYDNDEPLTTLHRSVDAPIQFTSLLFIPKKNMDMFGYHRDEYGLDLYVRRVLIQHQNKDLLPEYLSFVKGVVDSEDLPLNISRETLQENVIFSKIANSVTTQILSHLSTMADKEEEKYSEFWKEHGKTFKMGYMDYPNQEKFSKLLRFNTSISKDANELFSLDKYIERMKSEQKEIYYAVGSSREAVQLDPHIEIFKSKGIEILFLYDPMDEFVMEALRKYKDFEIKSVEQADTKKLNKIENVDEENKDSVEELSKSDKKHFSSLMKRMQDILGDKVKEVKESDRLKGSPIVLVNPADGISSTMQKIMNIQGGTVNIPPKIMEVNKNHKLIRNLLKVFKANDKDEYITTVVEQLYESSILLEGFLSDPHKLVNRVNSLLENSSEWYTSVKKLDNLEKE